MCFIFVLAPFIANDKPLVCKYKNIWLFPAFSTKNEIKISETEYLNYRMGREWKNLKTEFCIFPIVPYSPKTIDPENSLKGLFGTQYFSLAEHEMLEMPLKYRHWLGTTQNGTDVLSGIIHGAQTSLFVGFWSTLIAGVLGVLLGAMAGYFGNISFKIGVMQFIGLLIGALLCIFYIYVLRDVFNDFWLSCILVFSVLASILFFCIYGSKKLDKLFFNQSQIKMPLDAIISKLIEILTTVPSLLLIITIASIAKSSYFTLVCTIGLLSWTSVARVTRGEFLKAKNLNYVQSYIAIGMTTTQIMFRKILPNIFPVIFVQLLFIFSMAIIIESSLSFIGIAIPQDVSWGTLIGEARDNFSAWWLVIFPGSCIFLITYWIHKIQLKLTKR